MKTLRINVKDKIATYFQRDGVIVCGNKGYKIAFTFDEEWDEYTTKTARFIWNGKYTDKEFTDDECEVPVINDATNVTVGVYAGDLKTTTPAEIPCLISILCGNPELADGNVKEYRDIAQQAAEEAKIAAEEAKNAAEVVVHPTIDVEKIEGGHRLTINDVYGGKLVEVMNGSKGVGIAHIAKTSTSGLVDTYTITLTNEDTYTFTVTNGKDGEDGEDGESTGSGLTPEQLQQFNDLVQWHADSTYTTMTASISPSNSTYEIGSKKDITFKWSFKVGTNAAELSSLTFRGVSKAVTLTSETVTGISSTSSYTVSGTRKDGKKETKTATASVYFYNKYYFGCAADPGNITDYSSFIKTLTTKSALSGSRPAFTLTQSQSVNCPVNQYIWLAYPLRLGEAYFEVNGFPGNFEKPMEVDFTNNSSYTEKYYLYRSTEHSLGLVDKFLVS